MNNNIFKEKLTKILDFNILKNFDIEDLKRNYYIPLYMKNNILYGISYMPQLKNSLIKIIENSFVNIQLKTKKVSVLQFHATLNFIKEKKEEEKQKKEKEEITSNHKTKRYNIKKEILSLVPEDFIKLYKVFPIKYENGEMTLGMVNPTDKKTIDEFVFLTGLNPKIQAITINEFTMYIKEFFFRN